MDADFFPSWPARHREGYPGDGNAATEACRGYWACEMFSGSMGGNGARSGASTALNSLIVAFSIPS